MARAFAGVLPSYPTPPASLIQRTFSRMATKRLKRPRDPASLAKLVGDMQPAKPNYASLPSPHIQLGRTRK